MSSGKAVWRMWTCGHLVKTRPGCRHPLRTCGRDGVAIWCRVSVAGSAFLPRCRAHCARMYDHPDFERVPVEDFQEWRAARRVQRALVKPLSERIAEEEFQKLSQFGRAWSR